MRSFLKELGVPEPKLPAVDPNNLPPFPYEAEIRAVIAKLKAERDQK